MKTQFRITARGINCIYGSTWQNDMKSIKDAILLLKHQYITEFMRCPRFKNLDYFWLELYQSTKEEKELDCWTGGRLVATMGCRFINYPN